MMVYPERGWRWLIYRLPFWLWRMGLAPLMRGRFCMLTTTGRKSGQPRHTLLEYARWEGRAYVLAGWGARSHWVRNLLADPRSSLVSGLGTHRGRAVRVEDPAIARALYPELRKSPIWHEYTLSWGVDGEDIDDVADKIGQLWMFSLVPTDDETPEPGQADLWWIPVLLLLVLGIWAGASGSL